MISLPFTAEESELQRKQISCHGHMSSKYNDWVLSLSVLFLVWSQIRISFSHIRDHTDTRLQMIHLKDHTTDHKERYEGEFLTFFLIRVQDIFNKQIGGYVTKF